MLKRTVKIKLNPTHSDKLIIQETLDACNKALNWISDVAWEKKCFNRVALHHLLYYELREKFNLPSQIAISLKDTVCASYKADKSVKHTFKAKVLPLNFPRTAKLVSENVVSFNTLKGRLRIFMVLGDFQRQYLKDKSWKIRESEIVYSNHKYFLHLTVQKEAPDEITPNGILGVDRGIENIATLSTGDRLSGRKLRKRRERYQKLKSTLMAKGTRSAKRHLKKISGKEKRFQRHVNHVVSKQIVEVASKHGWAIALEELKGIKKRGKGKRFNGMLGRWATKQLEDFITYKAEAKGVPKFLVKPKYSSQECSKCHNISRQNRRKTSFCCGACGFFTHADRNGASIISFRGELVKRPNVASSELMQSVSLHA